MQGLMMDYQLTIDRILEHGCRFYARKRVLTKLPNGAMHEYTYADLVGRVKQLANGLESLGVLDSRMLLLHSGWFEPHEIEILARRKPTLVCCPSSSLHNGYGNLAVGLHPELAALGVNVSLGTDHASSGTVDLVQEMRNCACGYKEIRMNPRLMPPEQVLEMATINGARGAGLAATLGSIEVGKAADFVVFDATAPEWQPLYNPVSNLVYSATGSTVKDVYVGGTQVVRDGHTTLVDEAALYREVQAAAGRIAGRLDMSKMSKLRWPVS